MALRLPRTEKLLLLEYFVLGDGLQLYLTNLGRNQYRFLFDLSYPASSSSFIEVLAGEQGLVPAVMSALMPTSLLFRGCM